MATRYTPGPNLTAKGDHAAALPLIVPADWADLDGVSDANTVALTSATTIYNGLGYRLLGPDQLTALSAGVFQALTSIPDTNDTTAVIGGFGWRRTNFASNTTSPDFLTWFGVGNRTTGNVMFRGGGARYQGQSDSTVQITSVNSGTSLATPAPAPSLLREGGFATVYCSVERTGANNVDVDQWVAPEGDEPFYIGTVSMTSATSPFVMFGMHLNNNGHDGEVIAYGYRELTVAALTSEFGLTKP